MAAVPSIEADFPALPFFLAADGVLVVGKLSR
jgi:hypothetical protein